uniref:LemA family protein n=1 Tax=Prevotella sp. TaxID=59823 RepID=UPI00402A2476
MKKTGWIIVAVIVVLVLWLFSGYNGLVSSQEEVTTELANVQTQYQRRADMMPQLAKIVKAYAKHERETFEQVTKARAAVGQVKLDANNLTEANLKQFTAAQGELTNAFSKLMLVAERYPELKASENFKSLQIQEEGTENRISEARRKYNEAVQSYNVKVRRMPNAIIAGLFGFGTMPKFEAAAGSEKAPDLDI